MNLIQVIYRFFLLMIVCFSSINLYCQNPATEADSGKNLYNLVNQKYGLNQVLVHGKYFEHIYENDLGHPYFVEDEYKTGYLITHGRKFENYKLKFNIYDQTLVLYTSTQSNLQMAFNPPIDFISKFSIDGHKFLKYSFTNKGERFYEQIYDGKITCLCFWLKDRTESEHNRSFMAHKFSEPEKQYFLIIEDKLHQVHNRNSLLKLFPTFKKDIVQFMKDHDIKLSKSSGEKIAELIAFCDEMSSAQKQTASTVN